MGVPARHFQIVLLQTKLKSRAFSDTIDTLLVPIRQGDRMRDLPDPLADDDAASGGPLPRPGVVAQPPQDDGPARVTSPEEVAGGVNAIVSTIKHSLREMG